MNNFRDRKTKKEFYFPRYSLKYIDGEIVYIVNGKARPELENITKVRARKLSLPSIRTETKNR